MSSQPFTIFDQMIEGVQVIDKNYRYVYVNDAVAAQGKKSREELLGKTMQECYPGIEHTPVFQRIHECLYKQRSQEWINEFNFPDGSTGFFQVRMMPIEDSVLIMSFDVTDQKKAVAAIESANEYLEQEVRIRTGELLERNVIIEKQLLNLKELNETKDKFFSIVAHDLMAPLHSVNGLINLLTSSASKFEPIEIERITKELQNSVSKTLSLAENLITWAREQMNTLQHANIEPVKLSEMIEEVYGIYNELAIRKGVRLVCDIKHGFIALADRNQLSFVIRNMVNNAIKYTKPEGLVKISAENIEAGRVRISVSDNGIGMHENVLTSIRNLQVNRSELGTTGEKGTGLGLLLCYEFVKRNNGNIEIESRAGEGSTFKVTLDSMAVDFR